MKVRQIIKHLLEFKLDEDLFFEVKAHNPDGKIQLDELNFDKFRMDRDGYIWLTLES